jgi:hypothetical protein
MIEGERTSSQERVFVLKIKLRDRERNVRVERRLYQEPNWGKTVRWGDLGVRSEA